MTTPTLTLASYCCPTDLAPLLPYVPTSLAPYCPANRQASCRYAYEPDNRRADTPTTRTDKPRADTPTNPITVVLIRLPPEPISSVPICLRNPNLSLAPYCYLTRQVSHLTALRTDKHRADMPATPNPTLAPYCHRQEPAHDHEYCTAYEKEGRRVAKKREWNRKSFGKASPSGKDYSVAGEQRLGYASGPTSQWLNN